MTRILLAEDHEIVRFGLRLALEREADLKIVAEAANGRQALQLTQEYNPDVLILDVQMTELSGIDVAHQLHKANSSTRILVFSSFDTLSYILELNEMGIDGYILKDEPTEMIITAVHQVMEGKKYFGPKVDAILKEYYAQQAHREATRKRKDVALTESELNVLALVAKGHLDKEIADMRKVSVNTIKNQMSQVRDKFGASNRIQAIVRAVQLGLIEV